MAEGHQGGFIDPKNGPFILHDTSEVHVRKDPLVESDKFRREAKEILKAMFQLPPGLLTPEIDRLLECIISSAVLESGVIMSRIMGEVLLAANAQPNE